jgi:hypothetical protein
MHYRRADLLTYFPIGVWQAPLRELGVTNFGPRLGGSGPFFLADPFARKFQVGCLHLDNCSTQFGREAEFR